MNSGLKVRNQDWGFHLLALKGMWSFSHSFPSSCIQKYPIKFKNLNQGGNLSLQPPFREKEDRREQRGLTGRNTLFILSKAAQWCEPGNSVPKHMCSSPCRDYFSAWKIQHPQTQQCHLCDTNQSPYAESSGVKIIPKAMANKGLLVPEYWQARYPWRVYKLVLQATGENKTPKFIQPPSELLSHTDFVCKQSLKSSYEGQREPLSQIQGPHQELHRFCPIKGFWNSRQSKSLHEFFELQNFSQGHLQMQTLSSIMFEQKMTQLQ